MLGKESAEGKPLGERGECRTFVSFVLPPSPIKVVPLHLPFRTLSESGKKSFLLLLQKQKVFPSLYLKR